MVYGPKGRYSSSWGEPYKPRLRQLRLEAARLKGTHTKHEWAALHAMFDCCVSCGISKDDLLGNILCKDHIVPISRGGCDCIGNLQPVCRECNSSGVGADLRCRANPNWFAEYLQARS